MVVVVVCYVCVCSSLVENNGLGIVRLLRPSASVTTMAAAAARPYESQVAGGGRVCDHPLGCATGNRLYV